MDASETRKTMAFRDDVEHHMQDQRDVVVLHLDDEVVPHHDVTMVAAVLELHYDMERWLHELQKVKHHKVEVHRMLNLHLVFLHVVAMRVRRMMVLPVALEHQSDVGLRHLLDI